MAKPLLCDPALFKIDLSGKTFIVTGANSGIGLSTATQIAKQGGHVVMACRKVDQAQACIDAIVKDTPKASLEALALDLGNLDSIRAFAKAFQEKHSALHGLVNNAGVMNTPQQKTAQGFEMQFGVNHLGHFLLTELLLNLLKKTTPSRVVLLSSCYHDKAMGREGDIHFDDLNFESRKYDGWEAYAQSKLANLMYAKSLADKLEGTGVTVASVHPGWVRTGLARNTMPVWVQNTIMRPVFALMGMIGPWEGAQSSLHALLSPDVTAHSGEYFSQLGIYRDKSANKGGWPLRSPNPNAHDADKMQRLYDVSASLVGLDAKPAAAQAS